MGAKDSKRLCLSYEDAAKRMSDVEFKRICEAFKRLTGGSQYLSKSAFTQNVLGDGVPSTIGEWLYTACGGGPRGIALKDLICGLVLLTKGTQDEKIKFLWSLYCNDSGTHILRSEFQAALQTEGTLPCEPSNKPNLALDRTIVSLFGFGQDRVGFDHFRAWIQYNKEATILSRWLLSNPCVSLSSEVETPTFYQTLAGVTHLEEQDICELEKCFWALQSSSPTGHLDINCIRSLVCPPVPHTACEGLFLALDVNRDGHIDFKELCCGISAACRGPLAERMKFCFKIFDMDRDCYLDSEELKHMIQTLIYIACESNLHSKSSTSSLDKITSDTSLIGEMDGSNRNNVHERTLNSLSKRLDQFGGLSQEEFLVWSVEDNTLVAPLLELLFQVCHVSLGLKPNCRHHENEIVMGWLKREERRGFHVGQFWYLISSEWWLNWQNYTNNPKTNIDHCSCRLDTSRIPIEEGIVCDESLISNCTDYTSTSNEFNSNSMESMGDLLSRGDSCSLASVSSSGVSSSSGTGSKRSQSTPGPIDNSNLVVEPSVKVTTLTGEGGRLKRDVTLVQHRDFELVPDSLWKALALWYGGPHEECIKKSIQTKNHVQCTICLNTEFDKNHFYEYNHYILGQITCSRFNKAVMDFPNIVLTSDSKNRTSSENKKLAITSHTNEKCGFTSCMNSGTISCTECRGVYCESCDDALHKSGKQLQSHKRVLLQNAPLVLQRCPDHSIDEELFCNDCGVNCCCYCILEKHEGHSRSYLSRLNDEEEVALKNAYENAKIKKQQLLVSSWKVSKMEQTNMMSELEIEIAQQFADIHAQLYFMEKNLYQQAKQMQDSHFCLAGLTETINSNIQTIDKLINYVEERKTVKYNMKMLLYKLKDMENLPTILISSETVEKPKLVIDDTVKDLEKYVMLEIPDTVTFELINTDEVPKEYQEEEMKQAKIEIEAQSSRSKSSINTEISNNSRSRQNYEVRDNDFFRRQAVYVTHINSLDSFYVQLKENDNRFKQMEQEIRNHISTMLLGVGEVHMKELYLAKGIGDKNKWCRVRVMEKIGEKYKAKFIDFGYSTIVTKDELIYISSSLASKKPFAYECRLDNPSHFQWPKDTHLELAKFLDINKELDMETKEFSNNIRTVVLNINTSIGGSCSVTELLIFGCDALRKGTKIPEPMKENLNSNKIHDNSDVYIVNNSYDVFLRYVFDPWHIYIQKSNYEKSFNNLIKQMTGYYSKTQCDIHLPIKNSYVVVNYRTKYFGEWHRAKILEVITKKRIVNVYLVDIGEYINVLWKDIRKLFEGFKKSECFVVCAKLADVAPLTNNDWTITDEVAIRQFFESFLKRNVKMKILVSHNDPLEVVLFKPEETFDVNLNAELVENNFALSSGKLTDTKIWLHNEEYEKKEENNFLFFKDDTDDEDCDTEMRGPIQQVEIIHFENPDSFFVSFVSKKASAEKLHEEMQIHYKSLKHHPQERNWKVNDKAVIFDESDKMYYRGIIRVIDGNKHCVHFLDKPGYLWVGTEKLRIIQPYFMKNFPNTVFRCHLVNIKPAGDSNKWSNLSVEWFQMLFKKHQDIFIKKIADDESKSSMPVTIWYSKIIQGSALEPSYRKYISIDKKVVEAGLAFWVPNAVPPEPSLPDKEETTTGSEPDSESTTTTCDECDHKSSDTETTDSEATVIPKIGEVKFIDVKHWLSPSKFTRREFFAYVTCAENEGYLYIREEELQKSYEDMQQKITKHFDNIPFSPFVLREDQMVTVRSEGFWYRGVVLSVINKKTAKIMMVDFGSDHIVEINDLRNKIMYPKIPIMVSKIKLYDIHSKNKGWTLSEIETLLSTAPPYGKIVMRSNLSDAIPLADVYDTKGVCLSDRLVALCPNLYRLVNMPKIVTKNENIEVTNEIVQNYSESQSKESDESCEIIPSDFMSDVEQIRKLEENMEEMPIDPTDEETSEEEEIEKDSSEQEDAEDSEQVEENAILESEGEEEHGDLIADEVVPKRFNYAELTKATMERDIISVYDYKTISFYHPDENSTETEFETLTKSIRDNIEDVEPLSKAEIGQPCLCLFEEDNQWYRAKITRVDALECGYVSVIYVDYGNFEVVKFSNLKTIKSEWLEFPVRFVDAIIDYKLLQTDQENVLLKHIQSLAGKTKYIEIIYDDPVIIHVYNENDDTFQLYYDAFIKNGIVQI